MSSHVSDMIKNAFQTVSGGLDAVTINNIIAYSSVTEITTAVNKFATAMAVEAYRTRTWIAEIDRYLRTINTHISVVPKENEYMHSTSAAANSLTENNFLLYTDQPSMILGVAQSFGMSFSPLSSIISSADLVKTGGMEFYHVDPSGLNQSVNSSSENSQFIEFIGVPPAPPPSNLPANA